MSSAPLSCERRDAREKRDGTGEEAVDDWDEEDETRESRSVTESMAFSADDAADDAADDMDVELALRRVRMVPCCRDGEQAYGENSLERIRTRKLH